MWSVAGLAATLVSGLESSTVYIFEFLALLILWRGRRSLAAWLLVLVAVAGVTVSSRF